MKNDYYRNNLGWKPTRKRNGFSMILNNGYVANKMNDYLKELGNPYGVFINQMVLSEPRLYLMNDYKGDRKQIIDKINHLYCLSEFGSALVDIRRRQAAKLQELIDELSESERTDEKISELIHHVRKDEDEEVQIAIERLHPRDRADEKEISEIKLRVLVFNDC